MLDENGEWDGLIMFVVSKFLMWVWIFLINVGGIFLYFCLKGILLRSLILCFILFVVFMFVVFVENIFL